MNDPIKPMLASSNKRPELVSFPMLCSPKKDGFRLITHPDGTPQSRSGEVIPNFCAHALTHCLRHWLEFRTDLHNHYLDGELMVQNWVDGVATDAPINLTTSVLNSFGKVANLVYYVFDLIEYPVQSLIFQDRLTLLTNQLKPVVMEVSATRSETGTDHLSYRVVNYSLAFESVPNPQLPKTTPVGTHLFTVRIKPLTNVWVDSWDDVYKEMATAIAQGDEGVMLRRSDGWYKHNRATDREGLLIKVKRFVDSEATIVGFEELETTLDSGKETSALGYAKTTSKKGDKVPGNTLGALVVDCPEFGRFSIGTGFTDEFRKEVWTNQDRYLGKLIKFRYQPDGVKDKPRIPSFIAFRPQFDTDNQ